MWTLGESPFELVARTAIVYVLFFGALRVSGKREIGQFSLPDIALVLLAANALQPAMTGQDQSIPGGVLIILTIFILNRGVAFARLHLPFVKRALEFTPTTIGRDGAWLTEEFEDQGIDLGDVEAALRQHGLERVEQMKLATLEEDGSISIVQLDDGHAAPRHRLRRRYRRGGL